MTAAFPVPPELAGHPYFQYRNNVLYAEDVPLDHLAERLGTPLYVYSRAALKAAWEAGDKDKAKSMSLILARLAELLAGAEIEDPAAFVTEVAELF